MDLDHEELSRGIFGCCLADRSLTTEYLRWLTPEHLKLPWDSLFRALLDHPHEEVDMALLLSDAQKMHHGLLPSALIEAYGTRPAYFEEYLLQLRQRARIEAWWRAAELIRYAARKPGRDDAEESIRDILEGAQTKVSALLEGPATLSVHDLLATDYPEPTWAVPDLLPSGLTLFAGAPKTGKSAVILDIAIGVASGGLAMSTLHCSHGAVLYLSLDNDSERRLKYRISKLTAGTPLPADTRIDLMTEWPIGYAAIAECQRWVDAAQVAGDNPLMIVVDTLVKAEPDFEGSGERSMYAHSTQVLSRWSKFAQANDLAVVMVHHDRKSEADDWLNRFAGSRGITATAQTLMMLDTKRGSQEGILRVSGRDVPSDEYELRRWSEFWSCVDNPQRDFNTTRLDVVTDERSEA